MNGLEKLSPVTYYVMGDTSTSGAPGNAWRTADTWPPPSANTRYYLRAGKQISTVSPDPTRLWPTHSIRTIRRPPSADRHIYLPSGPRDQRKLIERPDVLSFTSAEITEPTEVTGRIKMKLYASSDAPDTDFFVKLCDVYPDGRIFNVCEGQLRARFRYGFVDEEALKPGEVYGLDIDLWSTSYDFNKGHKLLVMVTSSNAPGFDVNPNTGDHFRANANMREAHNTIYMDAAHPSAITLPIVRQ